MKKIFLVVLTAILSIQSLYATDGTDEPEDQVDDRWYTESHLRLGKRVFENNCVVCHAAEGQGITED
jgi:cytochrome c